MSIPKFNLKLASGSAGTHQDLSTGKVVLFSYPRAFTPGCTKEVCSIRDTFSEIKSKGIKVFGISADTVEKNRKFSEEHGLEYPLICDVDKVLLEPLGLYGEKKLYGKTSIGILRQIIFFEDGEEVKRIKGVKTANAGEQILKNAEKIGW